MTNPAVMKVVGITIGVGVLVYLVTRRGGVKLTAGEATTIWKGDPATCKCMRKRPTGIVNGKQLYVVEEEPDITLCVEDLPERCFGTTTGPMPAFDAHTLGEKTTDAIETVKDAAVGFWNKLLGRDAIAGGVSGAAGGGT